MLTQNDVNAFFILIGLIFYVASIGHCKYIFNRAYKLGRIKIFEFRYVVLSLIPFVNTIFCVIVGIMNLFEWLSNDDLKKEFAKKFFNYTK